MPALAGPKKRTDLRHTAEERRDDISILGVCVDGFGA